MKFKAWLEIVEPNKPQSSVRKSNFVQDQGTNVAKPAIRFSWKTQLGNNVKLHFIQEGQDEYEVMFYVNNTLYDDASANTENGRDPEILSGIFYLLKDRADRIGANRLTFRAYESEGDMKTVRGINPDPVQQQALMELQRFHAAVQQYQPRLIPPNQTKIDLWKKLGRGEPNPLYDFDKKIWLNWIPRVAAALQNNERMYGYLNELKTAVGTDKFNMLSHDAARLVEALANFDNAVASNSEEGWQRKRNRRAAIYSKLVNRIMADKWDIEMNSLGDRFTLTRKQALGENLNRLWVDHPFYSKETVGEFLARQGIPVANGRFTLYHGRPKGSNYNVLEVGTYLAADPKSAAFFAARDRGLDPDKDVEVLELSLTPDDIQPGIHITLRKPYQL
jgi:hypothetical protein